MMKQHYDAPQDPIGPTHPVEDRNCYLNFCQSDSLKMTDLEEDSPVEDSHEEADSPEVEKDSTEEEDTPEGEEVPWAPHHLEEDGVHHPHLYHKATMTSW